MFCVESYCELRSYRQQFTQLDTIMAQMKNTSTYLTQQFSASSKS
ncbi:hypothetical protein LMG23994_05989 [Cupriavidus pinatubonensis]|uniref:Uncharacterized protein n=1 Tax=Cupriavidus pinatubonensis TaxID=248026 RepID=A0ABM8XZW6_9BURK|nr:hypothetical protein LMG23994_05989 [Cupriavidus pinatubonensis]